jgi:hypothetical protein
MQENLDVRQRNKKKDEAGTVKDEHEKINLSSTGTVY